MEFVLTRMPANLHVVLATRADPALPLARFRAGGDLTEIRGDDLRFQPEEAGQLFHAVLHLGLADDDVELLYRRTEGWAAGLYLPRCRSAAGSDTDAVVKTFDGDHRYIADYLMAEGTGPPAREAAPIFAANVDIAQTQRRTVRRRAA